MSIPMPKVLVLMTTFNGDLFIIEQIESILNQVDVNVDLHIYDDCSYDNTIEIIKDFKKTNPTKKIQVNVNKKPSGSAAINFLNSLLDLKHKSILGEYDYIALSDQDDIWLPNKLTKAIFRLEKNYDLYCSNLQLFDTYNDRKTSIKKSFPQKKFDHLFEGGSAGCTYVMRINTANTVLDYYEKILHNTWEFFSHDWFIYFVSRVNSLKVFIDSDSFIKYRIHSSNVHGGMNKLSLSGIYKRLTLLNNKWYRKHTLGMLNLLTDGSEEHKLLVDFNKSYFHRILIIFKYNFQLIRSPLKFMKFALLNIFSLSR